MKERLEDESADEDAEELGLGQVAFKPDRKGYAPNYSDDEEYGDDSVVQMVLRLEVCNGHEGASTTSKEANEQGSAVPVTESPSSE